MISLIILFLSARNVQPLRFKPGPVYQTFMDKGALVNCICNVCSNQPWPMWCNAFVGSDQGHNFAWFVPCEFWRVLFIWQNKNLPKIAPLTTNWLSGSVSVFIDDKINDVPEKHTFTKSSLNELAARPLLSGSFLCYSRIAKLYFLDIYHSLVSLHKSFLLQFWKGNTCRAFDECVLWILTYQKLLSTDQ